MRWCLVVIVGLLGLTAVSPSIADASWHGRWIWKAGAQNERNYYLCARRNLTLAKVPRKALVRITADSRFKLWVNGRFVGRGPARFDPAWMYYDTYDLARYLHKGRNAIAVLIFHSDPTFQYIVGPAGLLFDAEIAGQRVASDASWRVHRADAYRQDLPKMGLQLAASEEFDARRDPVGWREAAFDDSVWERATVLGPVGMRPHVHLVPRDIPHFRETLRPPASLLRADAVDEAKAPAPVWDRMAAESLQPLAGASLGRGAARKPLAVRLAAGASRSFTLDFGREMIGFPYIDVRSSESRATVDLGYSELLRDGRVVTNRAGVHYADRLICRAGRQEYELFTQRAFRYMQVDVTAPADHACTVTIEQVAQRYATYPVWNRGRFECSDRTLNAVWKLGRYTVQQCMEDGYTDCPWRERGQWWGDARAEAYTTYYAFGDARLIRKAILQIGQGQSADGVTPGIWPASYNEPLPDFCLIWVMTLDDYARFAGDPAFVRSQYPKMVKALGWFDKFRDAAGLLRDVPNWVFIDWADIDKRGACTALNAYYVGALQAAERIAIRAGKPRDAARWRTRAAAQTEAMNARLWSDTEGAYIDALHDDGKQSVTVSEQANALCVLYGVASRDRYPRIFARLAENQTKPTVRCGSPYFSFYLLWAMHRAGLHREAVDYERRHWKVMIDAGATTAWEVWARSWSLCHGWSSGPTSLLPAWVLGVRPAADGMRRITIAPQTAGLRWARGTVPSPQGASASSWRLDGRRFTLQASVPRGLIADVVVPSAFARVALLTGASGKPRRAADGTHITLRGGALRLTAEHVRSASASARHVASSRLPRYRGLGGTATSRIAREKQMVHRWAAAAFDPGVVPPFSFTYGGKPSSVLVTSWARTEKVRKLDAQRTERTVTWREPGAGLVVRCVAIEYADYPTVEWTVHFRNAGSAPTPIIESIRALDTAFDTGASAHVTLHHWTGSPCSPGDYAPHVTELAAGTATRIATNGGRPTNSDMPYFNLAWSGGGAIAVLGWPGQWASEFRREGAGAVRMRGGQELTHLKLLPGEEIRTPLAVLQFYQGDWIDAQNVWRRWMIAHNLPRAAGKLLGQHLMMCTSDSYPGMQSNAADEMKFLDAYTDAGVKLDYWWIDAGWYPCDGPGWPKVGTWEPDPKRYPHGLKEVGDHAHARGLKFVVWFEPERVHAGTWLAENRPQWVLGGTKGGLLNLGDPEARAWITDRVDKLITESGIDLYRQDFNMDPLEYWRKNDVPDRQGMTEIRHVEGYLAFWDELRRRHPNLYIDTCASGGRRNDLETLRRAMPLLRSDYRTEPHGTQGHTYGISSWIPYYGTGVPDTSDYVVRTHWCPWLGIGRENPRAPGLDWKPYLRMVSEWRRAADYFLGDYYPLTAYTLDANAWMAWQFDRPEHGDGMLQAFRRIDAAENTLRVKLRGLIPDAEYAVRDLDSGEEQHERGSDLTAGLTVTAPAHPQAVVLMYRRLR